MLENFGGRKFFLTVLGTILIPIVPVVYSKYGIDSSTTQIVLGAIAGGIGAFGMANVMSDKYATQKDKDSTSQETK